MSFRTFRRFYRVLALESSCDDSCVALLDRTGRTTTVIDQFKKTLHSAPVGGIIPMAAHDHHHTKMAALVQSFCKKHGLSAATPPDLICCTRGPGMAGSLSSSIQLAKGLSIAWDRPLVGVHHMLGHLLVAELPKSEQPEIGAPKYPFLSLLCSGGHTMLVLLKSLTDHTVIADLNDIACGDSLDKCARNLGLFGNMLGKELEQYVLEHPEGKLSQYKISLPFKGPRDPKYPNPIQFSFASFLSRLQWHMDQGAVDDVARAQLAYTVQETVFAHIIDRINTALRMHGCNKDLYNGASEAFAGVRDFIVSGGVAANRRLREKLFSELECRNTLGADLTFHFPDLLLCTDNAIMIGVAGIQIFEELRLRTDLSMRAIRKWPMDQLLHVDGWVPVTNEEYDRVIKGGK